MLDMPATPSITSTSPGFGQIVRLELRHLVEVALAPASGSARWAMLRTVSAGPTMTWPGMVGLSTEAPTTPAGMPSSSMTSEMIPEQSPSAMKRSTAPYGGFGVDCIRMRSAAMRPVSFLSTMALSPQSSCIFALRTTTASRSVSSLRKARNSPGVLPTTSAPCSTMRSRTDGTPSTSVTCL